MFNVHRLPGIIFARLTVFTATACPLINPLFDSAPGQFTHERSNLGA